MTTIAVTRTKTGVMFASDEQVTYAGRKGMGQEKVFKNGTVTFGVAGDVRVANILRYVLRVPAKSKDMDAKKWVVSRLVPAMADVLDDQRALEDAKGEARAGMQVVFHAHGVTAYLAGDFGLLGVNDEFWAVGSGSDFAFGAMEMGADAQVAVEVACKHDGYTSGAVAKMEV